MAPSSATSYMSLLEDACVKFEIEEPIYHQLDGEPFRYQLELLNLTGNKYSVFQIGMFPQKNTKHYRNNLLTVSVM